MTSAEISRETTTGQYKTLPSITDSVFYTKKGSTLNKFSHERFYKWKLLISRKGPLIQVYHTRSIAEKEKEYTESHKIDELYEFSNDSSRD